MGYAAKQDLIDRYGDEELIQLTDRSRLGQIDDTVIGMALADADDEIEPYIAARYTVPLATVPKSLVRIACSIARYRLYDEAVPDRIAQDYKDAVRFLEGVAKGMLQLGPDSAGAAPAVSNGAEVQSGGRVFSRDDSGFI